MICVRLIGWSRWHKLKCGVSWMLFTVLHGKMSVVHRDSYVNRLNSVNTFFFTSFISIISRTGCRTKVHQVSQRA